jgi:hypothetical protein
MRMILNPAPHGTLPSGETAKTVLFFEETTPLFRAFLHTLPCLITAEADLAGCGGCDPATDAWIGAADDARGATLAALSRVLDCPTRTADDRAFQRVARVFRTVMLSDNPEEVALLRERAARQRWVFFTNVAVPQRHEVNGLVNAALDALELYLALDDVLDDVEQSTAEPLPDSDFGVTLSAA